MKLEGGRKRQNLRTRQKFCHLFSIQFNARTEICYSVYLRSFIWIFLELNVFDIKQSNFANTNAPGFIATNFFFLAIYFESFKIIDWAVVSQNWSHKNKFHTLICLTVWMNMWINYERPCMLCATGNAIHQNRFY